MGIGLVALVFAAAPPDLPQLPPPQPAPQPGVVEVAPPPRRPAPAFAVAAIEGGYRITLNRGTAELLQSALDQTDPKELAETLKKKAQERKEANPEDQTAKTLELAAFAAATQLPGFKKSLAENLGPGGVVITMTGLQAPQVKFKRPLVAKAAGVVRGVMPLLPDEARETIEGLRAMGRTTPLFWKVEPIE
jgi:hypothetical protein